jgi:hypothetical protein
LTRMSQQHVATFFGRRFERNVARTGWSFKFTFLDVLLDLVHLVRILGHVEGLAAVRALLDSPVVQLLIQDVFPAQDVPNYKKIVITF